MIFNYLKTAFRNLLRHRLFSMINILGLSVGIAGCIIIFLYLQFELGYDKFHRDAENIYRIQSWQKGSFFRGTDRFVVTPAPLAPAISENIPEVEKACRLKYLSGIVRAEGRNFAERGIILADSSFMDVFDFKLLTSGAREAFYNPDRILITRSTAKKYFGDEEAVGEEIEFHMGSRKYTYVIGGIMEDPPENSHFTFNMLNIFSLLEGYFGKAHLQQWRSNSYYTYIKINENAEAGTVGEKINELFAERRGGEKDNLLYLQPMTDIHLHSHANFEMGSNNDIRQIYLFAGIVVLILAIACFNYINLTTARSAERFKEIGLRKVLGANKGMIRRQFIAESLLTTFIAFLLSLILIELVMPYFSELMGRELSLYRNFSNIVILLIAVLLLVGLLAGSYPAIVFAKYNPVAALKGTRKGKSNIWVRDVLVILQFAISIALIIGAMIVHRQMSFMKDKDLGFSTDNIINVSIHDPEFRQDAAMLKNEIRKIPGVKGVSLSKYSPASIRTQTSFRARQDTSVTEGMVYQNIVDEDFIELYDIQLISGRNFSAESGTDLTNACIINRSLAESRGWKDPLKVSLNFSDTNNYRVIGVVEDFHFASLHESINPMAALMQGEKRMLSLHINAEDPAKTMDRIESLFLEMMPEYPFEYAYLTDRIDRSYREEERISKTISLFTALSIIISLMGMFGLTAFIAQWKRQEIGIRKVLGASVPQVILMIGKQFLIFAMIATLIAWPLIWYLSDKWLENFAFSIRFPWDIFFLGSLMAMIFAFLTVLYQSWKAATADPIDALRYE